MSATENPYILFAFANERALSSTYLTELDKERKGLNDIMDRNKSVYDKFIIEATARSVQANIHKYESRLVGFHFAGHAGKDRLLMEAEWKRAKDESDKPREVYNAGIAEALGKASHIKFVFLNGCNSALKAADFHKKGIPIVIGTQVAVRDDVAREFAHTFYGYLMDQKLSLKAAFDQAHITLKNHYRDLKQMVLKKEEVEEQIRDILFDRNGIIDSDVPYIMKIKSGLEHIQDETITDWGIPVEEPDSGSDHEENESSTTPSTPPTAKIPDNAYLLCNREKPSSLFDQNTLIQKDQVFQTSCFFIHGPEEELPDSLAQRFEELNLPKNLKVAAGQGLTSLEVEYPSKSDIEDYTFSFHLIMESLSEGLDVDLSFEELDQAANQINQIIGKGGSQKALLIQHTLSRKDFHTGFSAFVQTYLQEFWQIGSFQFGVPVVILFSVEYPKSGFFTFNDPSSEIEKTLTELKDNIPNCTILTKLEPLVYEDVTSWVRAMKKLPGLKKAPSSKKSIIEKVPDKAFKKGQNKRTAMKHILPILEEAVEKVNESR